MELDQSELDATGKIKLDDIYNRADPREYFSTLGQLDYSIPQNALPIFEKTIEARRALSDQGVVTAVDLGCSYGVNGALLKYGVGLDELYERYASAWAQRLPSDGMREEDRAFWSALDAKEDLTVVGLDVAPRAIGYARSVGLLDEGIAVNLEGDDPPKPGVLTPLAGADIVLSTGCVGYVGERTFSRLLAAANGSKPWFANFVLRMFPYEPIAECLAEEGYVTEKLERRLFRQRRFATKDERARILKALDDQDIDASGREDEGWYYAEFYLSRPAQDARSLPLPEFLTD